MSFDRLLFPVVLLLASGLFVASEAGYFLKWQHHRPDGSGYGLSVPHEYENKHLQSQQPPQELIWVSTRFIAGFHTSPCAGQARSSTVSIFNIACQRTSQGPYTVINPNKIVAPNGDPQTYFSWARYWWANCGNYCNNGGPYQYEPDQPHALGNQTAGTEAFNNGNGIDMQPRSLVQSPFVQEEQGASEEARLGQTEQGSETKLDQIQRGSVLEHDGSKAQLTPDDTQPAEGDDTFCVPQGKKLTRDEIWTECPFVQLDGRSNPEINLTTASMNMKLVSEAIQFNAIIFALTNDVKYAKNAVVLVRAFFTDEETGVRPNAEYAQIIRGRGKSGRGSWSGLIEWLHIAKVVNGILILRSSRASPWTDLDDSKMNKWASAFLEWLTTSENGQRARSANNNQASFLYGQLISLNILLGNIEGAKSVIAEYFDNVFPLLIGVNGSLASEAKRTRPNHYIAFAIEAMLNNAKMADDLGLDYWSHKTQNGSTIQDAINFALDFAEQNKESVESQSSEPGARKRQVPQNGFMDSGQLAQEAIASQPSQSPPIDSDPVGELAPHVFAAMSVYGDPSGRYARFLTDDTKTGDPQKRRSFWFMHLPCAFRYSRTSDDPYREKYGSSTLLATPTKELDEEDTISQRDTSTAFSMWRRIYVW